ncbi:MAG: tetratricopeptide repeat protein [Deltaproteobacteria bacterium]|nr:tetratricopeptide repeat protein [Deltaproteobacteria bacterium]
MGQDYTNRGNAYNNKGQYDRAISNFQKACDMGYGLGCNNLQRI